MFNVEAGLDYYFNSTPDGVNERSRFGDFYITLDYSQFLYKIPVAKMFIYMNASGTYYNNGRLDLTATTDVDEGVSGLSQIKVGFSTSRVFLQRFVLRLNVDLAYLPTSDWANLNGTDTFRGWFGFSLSSRI